MVLVLSIPPTMSLMKDKNLRFRLLLIFGMFFWVLLCKLTTGIVYYRVRIIIECLVLVSYLHNRLSCISRVHLQVCNLHCCNLKLHAEQTQSKQYNKIIYVRQRLERHVEDPEILLLHHPQCHELSSIDENTKKITLESDSESDIDLSDNEIEARRKILRERMLRQNEEEILQIEEDHSEINDSEISEFEEDSESDANNEPRLKPLFVRKQDRATIIEKDKENCKFKQIEAEVKKIHKERRKQTLRMVEESIKKDVEHPKATVGENNLNDVCTDEENDEIEYEAWKLRELKRIKREREEKEHLVKEQLEIENIRNMTDEERRVDLRQNPKVITNKALKGKYKFLQKYYHRGAFYLDEEEDVLKRDFAQATLEDHFDKTILPKVMQVKNFGRCGRTKYTHLVDQDTTQFDSPWYLESSHNVKIFNEKSVVHKQLFSKPSMSKRKIK